MFAIIKSFRLFGIRFGGSRRTSTLRNQIVLLSINSYAILPSIKRRIATKLGKRTISFNKSFLYNILGFGLVANKPRNEPHQFPLILGYHQLERFFIATLDALNQ